MTLRSALHLALHLLVPLGIAALCFRERWQRAFLLMLATMLVDLDHLLATPIYQPNRCSIGFHPLHTWPAMIAYAAMMAPKATRLLGLGLSTHMALDALDCAMM